MKVEVKTGEGLRRQLFVTVPSDLVASETEKKLLDVQRSTEIKGFRKGKVPMNMIRSMFTEQVKADVIDSLIKDTFPNAIQQSELRIASRPNLSDLKFADDGGFTYTADIEVFPEIARVDFDNLELTSRDLTVADKEVDEVVTYMRRRMSELRTVARPAGDTDVVVADLRRLQDPKMVLPQDEFLNSEIDLGNELTATDFITALRGAQAGDAKEIDVTYPADMSNSKLAGAFVRYKATVKEIKERILPEVDDAFAKRAGHGETALEMRLKIRQDLGSHKQDLQTRAHKSQLIRMLCERNPVPIPDGMIEEYLDSVVEEIHKSEPGADEKEIREHHRPMGTEAMRWELLWHRLAEQEKLEVSQADTDNWIAGFATRNNLSREEALEMLNRSGKARTLRESLLEEKVLTFLLSRARLTPAAPPTGA